MRASDVQALRDQLTALSEGGAGQAVRYGLQLIDEAPERVAPQVREAVLAIVSAYGDAAGEAAGLFYETQRPRPGFNARVAEPSLAEKLLADLAWSLVPLFTPDVFPDAPTEFGSRLFGVVQKSIATPGRETIVLSSSADESAYGIKRVARPNACAFCVYLSTIEAYAFEWAEWHKNCHCVNVPLWEDNPLPENPHEQRWQSAAEEARKYLLDQQYALKPDGQRWRQFFRDHPDLSLSTKNLAREVRRILQLAH